MSVRVTIEMKAIDRAVQIMQNLVMNNSRLRELHNRYAIKGLQWVDDNFRQEGALTGTRWRPLSENTIAGRRKNSSTILQNTGALRQSFTKQSSAESAVIGSALPVALWQHAGTKGPYKIEPRNAKALAFPVSANVARAAKLTTVSFDGSYSVRVKYRAKRIQYPFSSLATKKTYLRGATIIIARSVMHPGLPARPLLPDARNRDFVNSLVAVTENYIKQLTGLEKL